MYEIPELNPYFFPLPFSGGSKTGIPSLIGYFWLHLTQTRPFLSLEYLKSALQSGQAKISNKSFGIGSFIVINLLIFSGFYILIEIFI